MAACTLSLLSLIILWIFLDISVSMPLRTLMTRLTLSPPIFCTSPMSRKRTSTPRLVSLLRRIIFDLGHLKFSVADQGDFFILDFNRCGRVLEIKTRGDFLGGVVNSVFDFDQVGFANRIK